MTIFALPMALMSIRAPSRNFDPIPPCNILAEGVEPKNQPQPCGSPVAGDERSVMESELINQKLN